MTIEEQCCCHNDPSTLLISKLCLYFCFFFSPISHSLHHLFSTPAPIFFVFDFAPLPFYVKPTCSIFLHLQQPRRWRNESRASFTSPKVQYLLFYYCNACFQKFYFLCILFFYFSTISINFKHKSKPFRILYIHYNL